ncbi:hypothetical protein AUR63_07740 [Guyparkeria sp. XI15]|nr:hypothetical protein AUR63_07740 [Guyparkeria sp. XI15]OAE88515.1 hypothetical protein AWR35_07755 [Guyparkeria sp. WRN-7]
MTAVLGSPQAHATTTEGVVYTLGSESTLRNLYPDASWLPSAYADSYTNLAETIEHYTEQSLRRDGVEAPRVDVRFIEENETRNVEVTIHPDNEITRRYADIHPAFFDSDHAGQARAGVSACKATKGCWDPKPRADQPWAMFLPLGLPLATQQTVLFLDYPPIPALTGRDYLNNYTMCRWGRLMGAAGAATPTAFETIVDARPIAAPGSGESQYLPDPITHFNTDTAAGGDYLAPMLQLLTESDGTSRPIAVFGSDARDAWANMVGRKSVDVLDAGTTHLAKSAPATPWIATNHPDVTSYNCCPGDPASRCGNSHNLIGDEKKDFVAACWLITMSETPGQSPETVRQQCEKRWMSAPNAQAQQALCVQAKLDNNNPAATCSSYTEAWKYCAAHGANACASHDCQYDADKVSGPVAVPSERPAGWGRTCNSYR